MRTSKFMGVVCVAFVALAMGAPHAGASTPTQGDGVQSPHKSDSPSVEQKNVNAPLSFLSVGSNNGDVHQSNGVDPSKSEYPDNHDKADKRQECNCSQSGGQQYPGDNGQNKYQGDQGGNCGCDHNPPKSDDNNGRNQYQGDQGGNCGCDHNPPKHDGDYGRNQGDQGSTSCGCEDQGDSGKDRGNRKGDQPEVKQVNVNAPISILSVGSNNGDVKQSNDADTSQSYENGTEQQNINVPVAILSVGSNNGDVHQSNDIDSSSNSSGYQSGDRHDSSDCGCSQYGSGPNNDSSYGGSGNPLSAPTSPLGQLPGVNTLLGQTGGGGSPLGSLGL